MTENELHDKIQCAYKTYDITETTLICVKNNILMSLDMHLSADFDTVDHDKLLTFSNDAIGAVVKSRNYFYHTF